MKNKGVLFGFLSYIIWGFFPVYFKLLQTVPAIQVVAHRVVWSFLFLSIVIYLRRDWQSFRKAAGGSKTILIYFIAAVLLGTNWGVYIWAVNTGHVVESSLGYFINPLVNVALGVIFLRERLRPLQWLPVGLATVGVLYLTFQLGSPPWIALSLAFSFGLYGLVKKVAPLGSLYGLMLETALLSLPALGYLFFVESQGAGAYGHGGLSLSLLLMVSGLVTSLPLLLFASAARSIPLSLMGILQYVAPTTQFLLGVLLYREPFTQAQLIGFGFVWVALIIFTIESFVSNQKVARERQAV